MRMLVYYWFSIGGRIQTGQGNVFQKKILRWILILLHTTEPHKTKMKTKWGSINKNKDIQG